MQEAQGLSTRERALAAGTQIPRNVAAPRNAVGIEVVERAIQRVRKHALPDQARLQAREQALHRCEGGSPRRCRLVRHGFLATPATSIA